MGRYHLFRPRVGVSKVENGPVKPHALGSIPRLPTIQLMSWSETSPCRRTHEAGKRLGLASSIMINVKFPFTCIDHMRD